MWSGCYGFSISTISAIVLYLTIAINISMLSLLRWDEQANIKLFGPDLEMKKYLMLTQTILSLAAFVFFKKYTSAAMIYFKFWVFEALVVTLFFDLISLITTTRHLIIDRRLDEFWALTEPNTTPPNALYFFAIVLLICYFVIKLHTTIIIFCFGISFCNGEFDNNIELNTPCELAVVSLTPPPAYDECVIECEKPPSYASLLASYHQ